MAKNDKNYVSVWFWLLTWIVMGIPILNVIMTIVWAFSGDNESRKNYFKASILVFLIGTGIVITLILLGATPFIIAYIKELSEKPAP